MKVVLIAHKTANALSAFCFSILLFIGLDLMLPRNIHQETVQGEWREVHVVGGKYTAPKKIKSDERSFVVTDRFEFAIDWDQKFSFSRGDVLEVSTTPIFGIVRQVYLLNNEGRKEFKRSGSLLGNLIFLPLCLLFTSMLGLINYKNPQQAINFGSGTLVLLVLILWMIK